MDKAVERRTRGGKDHAPAAPQRPALFRHQHPDALGVGDGAGFRGPDLDDLQTGARTRAHVRKGEKGCLVVYANAITRTEHDDATGEDVEREIPFLKGYTVFNVEQIEGLPDIYYAKAESKLTPVERIARAEAFFAHMTGTLRHGGNRAYYAQELDYVQMPPIEAFRDAESYYATLAHEFVHSTKHPSRLQRDFGRKSWGDEGYAREELVAELGSAFLCADLELTPEVRDDHAGYIAPWLEALQNDKRCVVQAAHTHRSRRFSPRAATGGSARPGRALLSSRWPKLRISRPAPGRRVVMRAARRAPPVGLYAPAFAQEHSGARNLMLNISVFRLTSRGACP